MNPFAPRMWTLAHGRSLTVGPTPHLMGILNVTPDSFSDGGAFSNVEGAVEAALYMVAEGAVIIDIGGESTRPGAVPVEQTEEAERVVPVVKALASRSDTLISVDTSKAAVAEAALSAGAHIVNDVSGLRGDRAMGKVVGRTGAGLVAMHNSRAEFMPDRHTDPIRDQLAFLSELRAKLNTEGIAETQVVCDPGIGFGKEADENLALLARLDELASTNFPLLLGTSRKRFIGMVTDRETGERDVGTAVTTALGRLAGAAVFRVHDIATNRDALRMTEAVRKARVQS